MIVLSRSPKTSILFIGSTETAFSNSRRVHVTYWLTANFYMFRSYWKDSRLFLRSSLWNFPSIPRWYLRSHERAKLNFKWKLWQVSRETISFSQIAISKHFKHSRRYELILADPHQKFQGKTLIVVGLGWWTKSAPILCLAVLQSVPWLQDYWLCDWGRGRPIFIYTYGECHMDCNIYYYEKF